MTLEGVDFSFGRPGGAALVAAGKRFVVRYINGGKGKQLEAAEVADYYAHGLGIALVFESGKGEALSGAKAGAADAALAAKNAAALGFPASVPIYFAVDFNAMATEYPAIDVYLRGAAGTIGAARVGVYGHNRLLAHCSRVKSAVWFWQTSAWSGGAVSTIAHLYQYNNGQTINGALVDLTRALKPDYGQWEPTTGGGTNTGGDMPIPIGNDDGYEVDVSPGDELFTQPAAGAGGGHVSKAQTCPGYFFTGTGYIAIGILTGDVYQLLYVRSVPGKYRTKKAPVPDCSAAIEAAVTTATVQLRAQVESYAGRLNRIHDDSAI